MRGGTNFKIGDRIGRLIVISKHPTKAKYNRTLWLCQCDCGNTTLATTGDLNAEKVRSCGCLGKENSLRLGKTNSKGGISKERLNSIYSCMKTRCYNSRRIDYKNYGGRGITICDEWLGENGYVNFRTWALDNGYCEDLTIDRIDVNGNYEPSNCRWITLSQQARNKRNTVYLVLNNQKKALADWCDELNLDYRKILRRYEDGWSDYECIYGKENQK